ncbi:MAG: DUF262 domain-containing protein [Treponema sp.]
MENKTSFWDLLTQYKIEIPKIQRDYAQGRTDEKTTRLVDKFLHDIKKALCGEKPINLDFVYGRVQDSILIPIDGQQRLTTLFLLHWYFAVKEHKLTAEIQKVLLGFTYETRLTSRDFCKSLVEYGVEDEEHFSIDNRESLKNEILDSSWYFLSWKYDPTIVSMVNMIDKIHCMYKDINMPVFEKLIGDESPITFSFLPMEDFKLTDELYIKMNARGKQLTDFENFKTLFSEYFDIDNKAKLDNAWLDIFWEMEKTKVEAKTEEIDIDTDNVDTFYYRFLQNITSLFYTEHNAGQKEYVENYPLFSEYKSVYDHSKYIQQISYILDALTEYNDDEKLFEKFIDKPTYWDRIRFYAVARYFIWQHGSKNDKQEDKIYQQWMRVTRNLINNTPIESPEDYKKAIDSIKALSSHLTDMYEYVAESGNRILFFAVRQKDEEMLKARLILKDTTWLPLLEKAERHPYFDGQIGFILNYARNTNGEYSQQDFNRYAANLMKLFSKEFQEQHDFLFQRALLSKGNYLIQPDWRCSFCSFDPSLRAKTDNWRKVFNDSEKNLILKALLDDITNDDILDDLNHIIANSSISDWRKYIIDNGQHIAYCGNRCIYFVEDGKIYLLSKIRMSSYHRELFSYELYLKTFENKKYSPFSMVPEYCHSKSYDEPYILLYDFNYQEYSLSIKIEHKGNKKYKIIFSDRNENNLPSEVSAALETLGFKIHPAYADLNDIPEDTAEETVKGICTSLQQLN